MSDLGPAARTGAVLARALGLAHAPQRTEAGARAIEGAALMTASAFFLACSNASVRALAPDVHPFMSGFFLNLIGLMTIWPWVRREGWTGVRMKAPGLHAVRGIFGTGTLMAWMWALTEVELAKATALSFTAPLFAAGAAAILMGEPARLARWIALGTGFVGMLAILRPGSMSLDLGTGVTLVAAVGMAAMYLSTKMLFRYESSGAVIVNTALVMTPLSFLAALPYWSWPPVEIWPLILLMGTLGTLGRVLLTRALQAADASVVMPFDFGRLVFIAILGALFFDETPDLWTVAGSLLIAGAAAFLTRAEVRSVPSVILPPPMTGDEPCSRTKSR